MQNRIHRCHRGRENAKRHRLVGLATGMVILLMVSSPAQATGFSLFGMHAVFKLGASYAYGVRLENPSPGVVDAPGRPEIPVPEKLKFSESYNYDDGDLNFDKWDTVHNRLTLLGEFKLDFGRFSGIKVTGDAFYDQVYHGHNATRDSEHLNTTQRPIDTFTSAARYYSGGRARILDAYFYTTFLFGDSGSIDLKIGKHIAAWGQSLFFSGVALAQSPADATKATVPGASVKSILLPVNQISTRISFNSRWTVVGQWKFEYRPTELNPTGSFNSVSDLIGPGAKFAKGLKNPVYLDTLASFDLTNGQQLAQLADLLDQALLKTPHGQGPGGQLVGALQPIVDQLGLPSVSLPKLGNLLDAPRGFPVRRSVDYRPDKWDFGQWGIGLEYSLNYTTTIGFYHLNYHNTNPTVKQEFGYPVILRGNGAIPPITTAVLGLPLPVRYHVTYYDNIKLSAISFSTVAFGANFGGEFIFRNGIDVLVDVDDGLTGLIPTPTRAKSYQVLLNGINTLGPHWGLDAITLVGAVGYIHVGGVKPQPSAAGPAKGQMYDGLHFDSDAAAFSVLIRLKKNAIFSGWNLSVPISVQGEVYNRAAVAGAFGSLLGQGDYRLGIAAYFTKGSKLTLGIAYSGFLGSAVFNQRPLQDRDTLSLVAKYQFL